MNEENNLTGYETYLIRDYKYWQLFLHENQCYLGRSYVIIKRDLVDLLDITK